MTSRNLVTVREAADRLAVHRVTVRRMILRGELQALRIGGRYRVRLPEVAS